MLPRIGLQMAMPGHFSNISWHGRGPGESYPDSVLAAMTGLHTATVAGMYTPYVVPQEFGNRSDVRWLMVSDARGSGIFIAAQHTISFSAHEYSLENLTSARHTFDLEKSGNTELYLDHRHRGLGSATCGPDVRPEYEVKPESFEMALRFKPFIDKSGIDGYDIDEQVIPGLWDRNSH